MSEENKNLNEQPEKAKVEEKKASATVSQEEEEIVTAEAPKFNLDKKTIAIIGGAVAAVLVVVLALVLILGGGSHEHNFVEGKCECGESDPNYVPNPPVHEHSFVNGICAGCGDTDPNYVPHEHNFVEGKCECGDTDPNYVPHEHNFVNGECECGEKDPNYVPPHEHNFVNGECECGEKDPNYVPPHEHNFVNGECECGEKDPNYVPPTNDGYTLGLGIVYGDITNAQINATIATVVLDNNGVIVAVKLDAVQNKYSITADGINFTNLLTKKELGYNYNMAAFGSSLIGNPTVKEWFEQAAAFEAWCIGKTIAEVEAMPTQVKGEHNYVISADEDLLAAGCTISITDFIAAVVKAGNDEQATTFTTDGEIVLGLGINSADNGSTGDDFEATVKMNIDYAAVVTVDGIIVAALNDASQPQATIEDGEVIGTAKLISKRELKEGYNMSAFGSDNNGDGIVLEWYIQSAEFSKYIVGLTAEQVAKLEIQFVNGHYISADNTLLNAGCTMQITGIMEVVAEACGYVPSNDDEYTLGLGIVYGDITGSQINATIATVVVDSNGVIVAVKLDAVQNKFACTADGVVYSNLLTKKELGYNYNMAAYGHSLVGNPTVKEWFEQAAAFEAWCIGKTIAEVEAMELQTMSNGYVISADEDLLAAGCTISITDFIAAVVKAGNDEQATTFTTDGEIVLGLGINSADNGSTGDDFEATVKMNIDYAAVVTVDGVIVAALNDASQPQATIEDGEVISTAKLISKRELKEGYNMAAYGSDNNGDGIVLEWYIQSAEFSKYIVGLTAEQVAKLEIQFVNGHYISADNTLLNAGCTMQITGIMEVVAEACGYVPSENNEYTLGLGIVYGDINNTQINATIATVVLDNNGVIVAVKLDAVQNKYSITADGINFTNLLTKKELGYNYNMAAFGSSLIGNPTVKEWFEQAAAFEAWCIGKTIAEVEAMPTQVKGEHNYVISADEDLLAAGCTISITDFIAAVVKAGNDEQATTFTTDGEIVLGLGINSADNGSTGDDFEATVKMNIDYAAVVTVDGIIVAALNDASQPQATIEDGEVTGTAKLISKRELKEGYNMSAYGPDNNGDGIVLEWYIQSAEFSKYIVGLNAEQVDGLETQLVNGHYISTDDVLLSAGCTIQITGIVDVVVEACGDAA